MFILYKLILFTYLSVISGFSSCTQSEDFFDEIKVTEVDAWHQCDMKVKVDIEDAETTRATTKKWKDGSVLFLRFKNNSATMTGYATYHEASNKWTFNYKGTMEECQNEKCSIVFVDSVFTLTTSTTKVDFDYHSPVYTADSIYSFKSDLIDVVATLRPLTGRIRFESEQQKQVETKGLSYYTAFSFGSGTWSFSKIKDFFPYNITTSETRNGKFSTPYIHIVNPSCYESIWIRDGNDIYALKNQDLGKNIDKKKSGRLTLPSSTSYGGWAKGTYTTKSIKDITINKTQYGGWTQTQSSTRTYSNTGVNIQFDYVITGYDPSELSWTNNPLQIGVSGFDNKGDAVVLVAGGGNAEMFEGKYPDTNMTYHFNYNFYYGEKTSYYEVQFYYYPQVSAKITNFIISTY